MNVRQFPESDWKQWRKLSAAALERYCTRILDESAAFANDKGTAHERYLRLYRHIHKRDDVMATVFNDQRRSTAFVQIAAAVTAGIIDFEELDVLSEETQAVIAFLTGEEDE